MEIYTVFYAISAFTLSIGLWKLWIGGFVTAIVSLILSYTFAAMGDDKKSKKAY